MADAIVSIHVGGCGILTGDSTWELFCLEHGINNDGTLAQANDNPYLERFYHCNQANKYTPRAIFVDSTRETLDSIRATDFTQSSRYCPSDFVGGFFSKGLGYFSQGLNQCGLAESCLNRVRINVEKCDSLQGFLMYHSVCHGTGSGLGAYLLRELKDRYKEQSIVSLTNMPTSLEGVDYYWGHVNAGLAMSSLEHVDMVFPYQNHLIYNALDHYGIHQNRRVFHYIAQVISAITSTLRFKEPVNGLYQGSFDPFLNRTLSEIRRNIIHYNLNFATCAYAPIWTNEMINDPPISVAGLTKLAHGEHGLLTECDLVDGKYLAHSVVYRGDVVANYVPDRYIPSWKRNYRYRFCAKESQPMVIPNTGFSRAQRSIVSMSNHTGLVKLFRGLQSNFLSNRPLICAEELQEFDAANESFEKMIDICQLGNQFGAMFID